MRKLITLLFVGLLVLSCNDSKNESATENKETLTDQKSEEKKDLIKLKEKKYTEYYPDGVNVKFKGEIDEKGQRMGRWVHYSLTGKELNSSEYLHDTLHGVSVVRHPNGAIHYVGEYDHGKKVGKWVFRNDDGSVKYEEDYSQPEEK